MRDSIVRARIDGSLKERASEVLREHGLEMSDAIRLFLNQVVRHRGLPFPVRDPAVRVVSGKYLRSMKSKAQKADRKMAALGKVAPEAFVMLRPEVIKGSSIEWPDEALLVE